ncbi:NAD(P)H-dependent oxidoreductase [Streptomyces sodiiphilus]|uniref:NAD(P)H-dependent oxidoreductase n=1 Tax=Streptomyces sodiiphilus TaxID=226217 RepID=A0ABN2NRX2_9ACTN
MDAHASTAPDGPPGIAVITGSTREGRFGPRVAGWLLEEAARHGGMRTDPVDLAEAGLPAHLPGYGTPELPAVRELGERLEAADGFVVVTPEYNHSFPGSLKNAIDLYREQWRAKPVAFVSYGGMSGGLRAVEQLRLVFAELHAVTVRDCVSLHNSWAQFPEDGSAGPSGDRDAAAKTMFDQLLWWAEVLREARDRRPYAA